MKYSSLLLQAALCASPLLGQALKVVEPTDIADIEEVSDPQIAPDGKHVAYVVKVPVDSGKPKNEHIWLVSTEPAASAHPFALSSGVDTAPRWSPDGQFVAFLSTRKNPLDEKTPGFTFRIAGAEGREDTIRQKDWMPGGEHQLWLLSTSGGEALPLTDLPGGVKNPQWSHDGRFIAFIRSDIDTPKEHAAKERKVDQVEADHNYKFNRLWIYDLARREARLITRANISIDEYAWSPDGSHVIARVSPTPRIDDYWRVSKVVLIRTDTGDIARTIEEHAGYTAPQWSSDGHYVTYSRMRKLRITDEHIILDLKTGKEQLIEKSTAGTVEQLVWMPDGRSVMGEVIEGAHTSVVKVDAATGAAVHIDAMQGIAAFDGDITISKDGAKIVYLANTFHQPNEVWLIEGDKARTLTKTNPQAANWKLGEEREISWKNSKDGHKVYGIVVLPPDYKNGQRYKTAVLVHGGPEEAWTTGWHGDWYNYAAYLSSHGYVVLLPNPRGSDGQGPAFTEADFQDWGGNDFQDILDGADDLVHQGIADSDRMVVGGWSFGGFMTSWTVTHTNRFKAGMVGAGVTDLYTMATTTDIAPSFLQSYMGELEPNRAVYDAHSPVRFVAQCHTPVLVLHGEADPRVPISQGEELYNGLRFLGRDVQMVRYPREPHIFTEREHQVDSLVRILAWYEIHLTN